MDFHEYANIFPMMNASEFDELCRDMSQHGYRPECPIITYDGKILDGRNRFQASEQVGVMPMFTEYGGDDPLAFVLSQNLHRRHLNESQRGVAASRLETMKQGDNQYGHANLHDHQVTRSEAAEMLNVSPRTVATVKAIEREAPDLLPEIEAGNLSVGRAYTQVKQKQEKEKIRQYAEEVKTLPALQKKYNVIYADPPWQYSDNINTLDAVTDHHYSTLPIEKVRTYLQDTEIQVADNAVLFLWVTNPFIEKALSVIHAWGFEYKTNIVWVKTELKKPGVGYYVRGRHELLFICTRGRFTPLNKNISPPIGSALEAPVRKHSQKPDKVYNIIEMLYPNCVYLELFSRNKKDGWEVIGNDV